MNTAEFLNIANAIAPDKEAIIFEEKRFTFGGLNQRSTQLAHALQGMGIGKGDPVGIMQVNCNEVAEVYFACAKLGAIFVPLTFRAKAEELRQIVNASEARVVFAGIRYVPLIHELRDNLTRVEHFISLEGEAEGFTEYEDVLAGQPDDDVIADVDDEDTTILMFTAGTTGLPKGVMLTYKSMSSFALNNVVPLDPEDYEKNILTVPLYHVAGIQTVISSVYGGRTLVVQRQFDPLAWMELVERERVQRAMMVPTMLKQLMDHQKFADYDLSSLQVVTYGAAPMPLAVIKRAIELLPGARFINAFGQTESAATITMLGPEDHVIEGSPEEIEKRLKRLGSIGKPLADVEVGGVVAWCDLQSTGPETGVHSIVCNYGNSSPQQG